MIAKISTVLLLTIYYFNTCSFVSIYWPQCFIAKKKYFIIKNKILWKLLVGKFRGRNKIPDADFYKMTLFGLLSYSILTPCFLFFCIVCIFPMVQWWPFDSTQTYILSLLPPSVVLFLAAVDQIIGVSLNAFKKARREIQSLKVNCPKTMFCNNGKLEDSFCHWQTHYPQVSSVLDYKDKANFIFENAEKIVFDTDAKAYYFISGNDLLQVDNNGQFIELSPCAHSAKVLAAFRLGIILKFR